MHQPVHNLAPPPSCCLPACLPARLPCLQVEFNKAALSLADAFPADQKKAALNRLLKVGGRVGAGLGWRDSSGRLLTGC